MTLPTTGTLLVITPLSGRSDLQLVPYSARGLTQTLDQLDNPGGEDIQTDIRGNPIDMTAPQFEKYVSTISCTDGLTPCLDRAFRGQVVLVDCVSELSYPIGGTANRPEVSGSYREELGFAYYRPQLTMMVKKIQFTTVEWSATRPWQIDLQEHFDG